MPGTELILDIFTTLPGMMIISILQIVTCPRSHSKCRVRIRLLGSTCGLCCKVKGLLS